VLTTARLGKLDLEILPFVKLDHDIEQKRLSLSVENSEIKQQREMWG
jgi:large subunit ribosomal protein L6